jgi:hypothetical protein
MKGSTSIKKILLTLSPILLAATLYLVSHSSALACCGSSGGSGTVSGSVPSFNYDNIYYSVQFPSCPNPGGTVRASYETGSHWIAGEPNLRTGADAVYDIGNNNFVQCYCPEGSKNTYNNINNGIQTNWIKSDKLSANQKGYLLRNGWKIVAKGEDFGLPAGEYLYFNLPSRCGTINCLPGPTTAPYTGRTTIGNQSAGIR